MWRSSNSLWWIPAFCIACSGGSDASSAGGGEPTGGGPTPGGCYPGEAEPCLCDSGLQSVRQCLGGDKFGACECDPWGPGPGEFTGGDSAPPGVRLVELPAFDIQPDPTQDVLYITIGSPAAEHESSLVALSADTGAILWATQLGGRPSALAIAADGSTAYTGTRENPAIVKVSLGTHAEAARYPIPPLGSEPLYAYDMDVVPGNANRFIVVYSTSPGYSSQGEARLIENGVTLGQPTPWYVSADEIAIQDATTAYGLDTTSTAATLVTLGISSSGLSIVKQTSDAVDDFTSRLAFDGQWLIVNSGQVIDPGSQSLVGTYALSGHRVSNRSTDRVYVAGVDEASRDLTLTVFDRDGFSELGKVTLKGIEGAPLRMVQSKGGTLGLIFDSQGRGLEPDRQVVLVSPMVFGSL